MSKFSEVTAPCFVSGHDFSRAQPKKDLGFSPCAFFQFWRSYLAQEKRTLRRIGSGQAFCAGRAVTGA
jgi:hypothetical protein